MEVENDSITPVDLPALKVSPRSSDRQVDAPEQWRCLHDRLVRLAYRFLWNHEDAEDVAQDSMLRAMEKAEELREPGKWWSWLCRITVHRCHEHGRSRQRRRKHEDRLTHESRTVQPHDEAGLTERSAALARLLVELPRRQHEVLVLRHVQGMSFDEIADVLGISASTARVHAIAARESLRSSILRSHPAWLNE